MPHSPIAAGGSSFELIDSKKLFAAIQLEKGMTLLDIACGYGYYSLAASTYVGEKGIVYAVDLWQDGISHLSNYIKAQHIGNIQPLLADAREKIPLKNSGIDVCLLATVLHDFILEKTDAGVLKEIQRIIKPGGLFAVLEFKKIESRPGPPMAIRITPDDVATIVAPYGFTLLTTMDVGDFHYLSIFRIQNFL